MTTPTTSIRLVFTAFTAKATRNVDNFTRSMDRARVAAGLFVAGAAVRNLTRTADQFTRITNQVRVTAREGQNVAASTAAVFAIAQQTRSEVQATATTYTRLARVGTSFNATQAQVLRATEAIQKSFQIGGTSAKEAAGSAFQLSQALGSGRLNGDELRAVLEGNLPLAQAIAREFGVGVGQLKDLGAAGELTSDRVFKAILNASQQFDEQFKKIAPTFEQSATVLENSFIDTIGRINQAFDISGESFTLADRIAKDFETAGDDIIRIFGGVAVGFNSFFQLLQLGFNGAGLVINEIAIQLTRLSASAANFFGAGVSGIERGIGNALRFISLEGSEADKLGERLLASADLDKVKLDFEKVINDLEVRRTKLLEGAQGERQDLLDAFFGGTRNVDAAATNYEEAYRRIAVARDAAIAAARGSESDTSNIALSGTLSQKDLDKLDRQANAAIRDQFDRIDKTAAKARDALIETSTFADEAARNIQTAFADFLFDPLESGFKGMLSSFIDIIRRMVAEAAAANILGALFPDSINSKGETVQGSGFAGAIGNAFGSLLGFRDGGSFTVGGVSGVDQNLVAFRATRGEDVSITKPGQSSGALQIVNNINVSGNGVTMAEVNAAVSRGNQATFSQIQDLRRRGR